MRRIGTMLFFSSVHGTYSRLDYFMVDHSLLDYVKDTKIGVTTLSDHARFVEGGDPGGPHSHGSWMKSSSRTPLLVVKYRKKSMGFS